MKRYGKPSLPSMSFGDARKRGKKIAESVAKELFK